MAAGDVIVLAGGLGTRLRGVVPDVPKPLAPVAGRPFLAHLLDMFAGSGMRRVILATGYRANQISDAIGARWSGMEVVYSVEPEPLGTGGAIALALPRVAGDGVHVANGDTFLRYAPQALERTTRTLGCPIGIALANVEDIGRYGAVDVDAQGRVSAFAEKGGCGPGWINAGSYFLTSEGMTLVARPGGYSFETDVLQPAAATHRVAAFDATCDFIDIGVPADYARSQRLLGGHA